MNKNRPEVEPGREVNDSEYSDRLLYVLPSLDGINENDRKNYYRKVLSEKKTVYVRKDILEKAYKHIESTQ
ncbi:MAG: hypothetical protein PHV42_03440, partial [Candidatus Pacebacteria bacterium]|nr:hypothetical protein [Candidatus Paceibacterota bacterium]